jgi:hypothetical protein
MRKFDIVENPLAVSNESRGASCLRTDGAAQFAIILTITGDVVTRFQMLEDSFDVSKAART